LVKLCGKEIECGEDAAVGPEIVLLHDLVVVYGISNVDVCFERKVRHGRIEVEDIRRRGWGL